MTFFHQDRVFYNIWARLVIIESLIEPWAAEVTDQQTDTYYDMTPWAPYWSKIDFVDIFNM